MKRKFWNWIRNEDEGVPDMERTLFLNGMISDETWYGDVFSAAQIYNMLREYNSHCFS